MPTLQEIADKIDDVARALARQTATVTAAQAAPAGPDVALLVDLHTLRVDALTCAGTARSRREQAAFHALAGGLERMMVGRGGLVVAPAVGDPFDGRGMEAAEVVVPDDPGKDRTVAGLLEPGLEVAGRSVRPARVAVFRTG